MVLIKYQFNRSIPFAFVRKQSKKLFNLTVSGWGTTIQITREATEGIVDATIDVMGGSSNNSTAETLINETLINLKGGSQSTLTQKTITGSSIAFANQVVKILPKIISEACPNLLL